MGNIEGEQLSLNLDSFNYNSSENDNKIYNSSENDNNTNNSSKKDSKEQNTTNIDKEEQQNANTDNKEQGSSNIDKEKESSTYIDIESTSEYREALKKKAFGYFQEEIIEDYIKDENGELMLNKRRVTKKEVPPDIVALKFFLESKEDYKKMTDEELEKEKIRLLGLLKKIENKEKNNGE